MFESTSIGGDADREWYDAGAALAATALLRG
jgi:hypothetical protein